MNVILKREHYDLLRSLLNFRDIGEYDYSKEDVVQALENPQYQDDNVIIDINDDQDLALSDYIQDKKMEYGFDKDWEANELGQQLSFIWDRIYEQTEFVD